MFVLYAILTLGGILFVKCLIVELWNWIEWRRKLSLFKSSPESHWFYGVTNIITEDRRKSFIIVRKWFDDLMKIGETTIILWFFNVPMIYICNYKDAEHVISGTVETRKNIVYEGLIPWLGKGLLTNNGVEWRRRRKILTPAFHFNILPHFVKVFNEKSKSLIQNLTSRHNDDIDIIPFINQFAFEAICETAMGLSSNTMDKNVVDKYHQTILDFGNIFVKRIFNPWMYIKILYIFTPTYWHQRRLVDFLHKVSSDVINLRKKQFEDFMNHDGITFTEYAERKTLSMLDILLLAQKENNNIDDEGIREEVNTFMFEGHDTVMMCLIFNLMLLANHKTYQDRLYEELESIIGTEEEDFTVNQLNQLITMEMCIKESLRLYPSVPLIARIVDEDVKLLSGKIVPAKTNVFIDFWNIHRDPALYPNPEIYDPNRFSPENITQRNSFAYLPFSAGPRNCIGQKAGMLEVKCALAHILRNFILEPVDTPESLEFLWDPVLRTSGPIRIKLIARN